MRFSCYGFLNHWVTENLECSIYWTCKQNLVQCVFETLHNLYRRRLEIHENYCLQYIIIKNLELLIILKSLKRRELQTLKQHYTVHYQMERSALDVRKITFFAYFFSFEEMKRVIKMKFLALNFVFPVSRCIFSYEREFHSCRLGEFQIIIAFFRFVLIICMNNHTIGKEIF